MLSSWGLGVRTGHCEDAGDMGYLMPRVCIRSKGARSRGFRNEGLNRRFTRRVGVLGPFIVLLRHMCEDNYKARAVCDDGGWI